MRGLVKWFNNTKCYGSSDVMMGQMYLSTFSAIVGDGYETLNEGDKVEFDIVQGPKGPQAANVIKDEQPT